MTTIEEFQLGRIDGMTNLDPEMVQRALAWAKANDGGRLCVWWPAGAKPRDPDDDSRPIMAINWDGGGTGELGAFYDKKDAEAMETICDIFNWALDQLAPSERGYYGDRTYEADKRAEGSAS
ncbi:hypothetical protein IU469_22185 [Nocardia puris]|uniref:hypothetical protein n=1 Tax=Nocardia puris TaxID=208602 RepID=UPI001894913C|nr:hypothetical protein [Nocardia puris]MBF6368409.1 hypothetical protein [Nocardia puris]